MVWKPSKTVRNVPKQFKIVQNGPKWAEMVWKWSGIFRNSPKQFEPVLKWSKNGPEGSGMVQNGPEWSEMVWYSSGSGGGSGNSTGGSQPWCPNSDFKLFPWVKQKFNNLFYFQKSAGNFSEFSKFSAWSHQLRNYLKYFQCKSQYQVQSGPKMAQLSQIASSEKWKTSFLQDESKIEDILRFFPDQIDCLISENKAK